MKKLLAFLLAVMIITATLPFGALTASAETEGYYTYTVTDGEATITGVDKSISGDITIPSTLGGYPVTSIGNSAFYNCTGLTSVTIPDSVTSIGNSAFYSCTGLTSMTIPNSVTNIGERYYLGEAFAWCTELKTINYQGTIADWCSISFGDPDSNPLRNANAFYINGEKITKLVIPDTVTSIGYCAFFGCTGLTSITIPDSVTSIAYFAFSGCTGLTSVTMGNSVRSIGGSAFSGCTGLTSITIPDSVTSIGERAFYNCTGLTNITIPDSVIEIEESAFSGCSKLKDVYYKANKEQKEKIYIGGDNTSLRTAIWHYMSFPDVNYSAWYGNAVSYAVISGLMKGYAGGKFGTADGIQRQDFVVILSRLSGDDLSVYEGQKAFKDVAKGAYYAAALAWAKTKGVSSGYANGKFGVGDKVTREQIMVFLYNYAKLKGYDTTATMTEAQAKATYADFGKVSGYAKEAALWALSKGVVSGKDAGGGKKLIAPQANALRCEVAAMFYNINEKGIFA